MYYNYVHLKYDYLHDDFSIKKYHGGFIAAYLCIKEWNEVYQRIMKHQ